MGRTLYILCGYLIREPDPPLTRVLTRKEACPAWHVSRHVSRVTCHVCVTSLVSSRAVSVLYWPMFALCGGDAGSVDIQPSPWYLDIYSFLLSEDITIYSLGYYNIHNNSLITTKHGAHHTRSQGDTQADIILWNWHPPCSGGRIYLIFDHN